MAITNFKKCSTIFIKECNLKMTTIWKCHSECVFVLVVCFFEWIFSRRLCGTQNGSYYKIYRPRSTGKFDQKLRFSNNRKEKKCFVLLRTKKYRSVNRVCLTDSKLATCWLFYSKKKLKIVCQVVVQNIRWPTF